MSAYSGNNEVSPGHTLLLYINIAEAATLVLQANFIVPISQAYRQKLVKMSRNQIKLLLKIYKNMRSKVT